MTTHLSGSPIIQDGRLVGLLISRSEYSATRLFLFLHRRSPISSIGDSAFYDCTNLSSIELPDSVTNVDYCAFAECTSLESVKLSKNLTSIEDLMFLGCINLQNINIPDSVTNIRCNTFGSSTSLDCVEFETVEGWCLYYTYASVQYQNGTSIPSLTLSDSSAAAEFLMLNTARYCLECS